VAFQIRKAVLEEWGRITLTGVTEPHPEVAGYLVQHATTGEVIDLVEAWVAAMRHYAEKVQDWYARESIGRAIEEFRGRVNDVFDDEDLAYQFVGDEILERSSMVMHGAVLEPALSLLHGESQLASVEKAFQDALRELKPGGDPADAITDAGTALQELLIAAGARGNALGPLLKDARNEGLLGPYDSKLANGVELIGEWVSADRSERGDAHRASEADRDDAWLAVHVTGALIVRLAKRIVSGRTARAGGRGNG